jgi:hypothetical protein
MNNIEEFNRVVDYIASKFNIDKSLILSTSRKKEYVSCRQIAIYLIRSKYLKETTVEEIATFFNKEDHTTVLHALRANQDKMDLNKEFKDFIEDLHVILFKEELIPLKFTTRKISKKLATSKLQTYKDRLEFYIKRNNTPVSSSMWDKLFKLYEEQKQN